MKNCNNLTTERLFVGLQTTWVVNFSVSSHDKVEILARYETLGINLKKELLETQNLFCKEIQ